MGETGSPQVERHGSDHLMVVRLPLRARLQNGDGTMADVVVEPGQQRRQPVSLADSLPQDRFKNAGQKKGVEQVALVRMSEKIGMVRSISRQYLAGAREGTLGLAH